MKTVAFDDLARLPVARDYEAAFRKATGVSLTMVPPDGRRRIPLEGGQNPFCALVSQTHEGCKACGDTESVAMQRAALKQAPQQVYCYAGLTIVAVPVLIGGQHVATLLSGQVLRREPTQRDFAMVAKMLGDGLSCRRRKEGAAGVFCHPCRDGGAVPSDRGVADRVRSATGRVGQPACHGLVKRRAASGGSGQGVCPSPCRRKN